MAKTKVNITMDDELLSEVDKYCEKNFTNRSGLISQALVNVLNQQKMVDAISNVSLALKKCADNGFVDDETRKQMETFETLSKLFVK